MTVPEEQLEATFLFEAPSTVGAALVTASLGSDSFDSTLDIVDGVPARLILNEVDYDTVGTDNAEFVELYNAGSGPVLLDALSYEGSLTAVVIGGVGGFSLVEGTASGAADNNDDDASLVRLPDGADADNAADDWFESEMPTTDDSTSIR